MAIVQQMAHLVRNRGGELLVVKQLDQTSRDKEIAVRPSIRAHNRTI